MKRNRSLSPISLTSLTSLVVATTLIAGACGHSGSTGTTPATPPVPLAPAAGDFGTLKAVCGHGDAKGASDKFVTDTSIDVGTMADPGAQASPGLDQELFDTADAFVKWCNAAGGVLGRTLNLHKHDAKLFEVPPRMLEACNQDFALVGNGTAFDDAGVAPRTKCGLPEIPAFDNSPQATEATLKVQGDPLPIQQQNVSGFLAAKKAFPGATKIAFITGNLAGILVTRDRLREAAELTGLTTAYDKAYRVLGPPSWDPFVLDMKGSGADFVVYTGDTVQFVAMQKSMQSIGWHPKAILEQANQYDARVTTEGGAAISNTWVVVGYHPFEEAKANASTQQYLDLMHQHAPGGKIATLGLNAWGAWLLFATAARDCGSSLTRSCLLQKAGANTAWTAGGLKAAASTDPTNRQMGTCVIAMKATPTGFVRDLQFLAPNQGVYSCDPSYIVTLKHNYVPAG